LGSPSRIFYKTEDKMKIHLPQSYRQIRQRHSDFFYNYFTLGLDVLFDSHTHTVISFVLHTNLPGEYTFNTYYRCMFEIPLEEVEGGKGLTVTPFTKVTVLFSNTVSPLFLHFQWSEIKLHLLDAIDAEPVVIHRETKPPKNPYGSTHAYGYQDIIFEVSFITLPVQSLLPPPPLPLPPPPPPPPPPLHGMRFTLELLDSKLTPTLTCCKCDDSHYDDDDDDDDEEEEEEEEEPDDSEAEKSREIVVGDLKESSERGNAPTAKQYEF
uniref:UPF0183 protein C16orf70 n=1 Tax=Schistocephalus solidus TaxID=70667 RepID=A0A183TLV8_SCHSO